MNSNFRWFVAAALTAVALLPIRAQAQVQNSNVGGGNKVAAVQGARPAPARNVATAPSFHGPSLRSVHHQAFNAGRPLSGAQRFESMRSKPAFRPAPRFVGYNLGNQRPAAASGAMNAAITTTQIANDHPASQGTRQKLTPANNANRLSENARNHVFTHRSGKWHSDWDHHHDHLWHGHLCHFVHNTWIVYEVGFYPWWYYQYPYDYSYVPDSSDSSDTLPEPNPARYSYATVPNYYYYTGQNDGGDYDQEGNQDDSQAENDNQSVESSPADRDIAAETVSAAQDELAREGYYHGPIDGVFSPETHRAVSDFQKDNDLNVTGYLSRETRNALELDEDEGK